MGESSGFVADGHDRAERGIRAQVEAEYAERLKLKQATREEEARLRGIMRAITEAEITARERLNNSLTASTTTLTDASARLAKAYGDASTALEDVPRRINDALADLLP